MGAPLELDMSVVRKPDQFPGSCGDIEFTIRWKLKGGKSAKNLGGFVIQKAVFKWSIDFGCKGKKKDFSENSQGPDLMGQNKVQYKSPLVYWEAWRVKPSSSEVTKPVDGFVLDIGWFTPSDGGGNSKRDHCGIARIEGEAVYHNGVATLPPHMKTPNLSTFAGPLPSSIQDPNLGGVKSKPIKHWVEFKWNCCKESKNRKTEIVDWGPKEK